MGSLPGDLTSVLNVAGHADKQRRPSYAAHLKKVVVEEGYSSSTLIVVLQMIVRNRESFYHSRQVCVPMLFDARLY